MNPITQDVQKKSNDVDLKALYAATATLHDSVHQTVMVNGEHNIEAFNPQQFFANLIVVLNLILKYLPLFIPGGVPPVVTPPSETAPPIKEDLGKAVPKKV